MRACIARNSANVEQPVMPQLPCVFHFHCGQLAGSKEHVFPAALGGRRTDRRILCKQCQAGWSNQLDEVLPSRLRILNLHVGVVGDHSDQPARGKVTAPETGNQFLLNGAMGLEGFESRLLHEQTDETGYTIQRYQSFGVEAAARVISALRERGFDPEVLSQTVEPILHVKPLTADVSFGGIDTFRAAARITLNFLATKEPSAARSSGLESLKRWIMTGAGDWDGIANLGSNLPSEFCLPNQFEFGHRVAVGIDSDGAAFGRVNFFDVFSLAFRLGAVDAGTRRYFVWDIDPTARAQKPGIDLSVREFEGLDRFNPSVLGEFAASSAAVADEANKGFARIADATERKANSGYVAAVVRRLTALSKVPPENLLERVNKAMESELQIATNLIVRTVPVFAGVVQKLGYELAAKCARGLIDGSASDHVVPLARALVLHLAVKACVLIRANQITFESVNDLLFGLEGHSTTNALLMQLLGQVPIWTRHKETCR